MMVVIVMVVGAVPMIVIAGRVIVVVVSMIVVMMIVVMMIVAVIVPLVFRFKILVGFKQAYTQNQWQWHLGLGGAKNAGTFLDITDFHF